jgi:Right handed beta helix region
MRALCCAAILLAAGCGGTKSCKDKTVLVSLTLGQGAAAADSFDVTVVVGTNTLTANGIARKSQAATGTLEIDFPDGYPSGQSIEVTVTAKQGGTLVGTGMNGTTLRNACATLGIQIGAPEDLSVPLDLASPDLRDASVAILDAAVDMADAGCGHLKETCCAGNACLIGNCYGICDYADLAPLCVVAAAATHYVDPAVGADDGNHGGSPQCPYRTITYALTQASGTINLAAATYTLGMGGETTQWTLQSAQEVDCSSGAKLVNPNSGDGGLSTVLLLGSSNIRHCEVTLGPASIEVGGSPAPHVIDSCDIHGGYYGIYIPGDQVTISSSTIHGNGTGGGIHWVTSSASATGTMTNNTFTGNLGADISCGGNDNSLMGSGNTDNGGAATCTGCVHCPYP